MAIRKLLLLTTVVVAIIVFYWLGGAEYLKPDFFKSLYSENPKLTAIVFFSIYLTVTSLALPGAAILTMICGYIFGFLPGLIMVSFASTLGATVSFLLARTLFRDYVQRRFASHMNTLRKEIEKDGAFYLFTLRLIPAVPFFVINLVMGLMPISTWTFYWVSQIGMLAGTAVFVNAGVQVGAIEQLSVSGVLTPELISSLILLGIMPLVARKGIEIWKHKRSN
ncbi:MAG: TVP38/TMEM64 family protein [Endozoicomonas sp. (ex Botrylloides leachii)]|nr:TVP38/TMEM64 family protein [Endozoicomonas sp. (ex Botrylloides leachii)]